MTKIGYFKSALLVAFLFILAGCGSIEIGGKKGSVNLYNLTPKSTFAKDLTDVDWKLVVATPIAEGGLGSKRIALHPTQTELKYFADASWTARTPEMIQTLLIESFTNTGRIDVVGRDPITLHPDYILKSELREFQAEYYHGDKAPTVRVRLNLMLIDTSGKKTLATESFTAAIKSSGTDMTSIVLAFDEALGKVLRRTVEWVLTTP